MSHLPISLKKSADYHRFFYLCLSLEIGGKYRLVGIRLLSSSPRYNYTSSFCTSSDLDGIICIVVKLCKIFLLCEMVVKSQPGN